MSKDLKILYDIQSTLKKIKRKVRFYYVSRPQKWQIKIFRFLGISEKKLIDSSRYKHIFADEIICIDHPWYKKGYIQNEVKKVPSWIIHVIRKIFFNKSRKFNSSRKIFLDRSNSNYNHCQIENILDIKDFILKNKFGIYKPEILSLEKQIYLFKNAGIRVFGAKHRL